MTGSDIDFPGALVQKIKIKAGETAESHYHKKQTEMFYFFDDRWYWIVNGEKIYPKAGDLLVIQPNDKHTVFANSDEDYIYLVFKVNYEGDDLIWD